MATKIIMFTGTTCSKCKRAKEMLTKTPPGHEVELIERNVDKDEHHKLYMMYELESNTLPTFIINPGKEGQETLRGFDENIGKIMDHIGL
ncbi:NrdH-redoxin [Bacillus toyonensis]|uniref:glutaredoxin family protein n=1 Tax=Bacillus toyonensis TaxID=155322 RepID=UPI000BFC5FBB|nr:glutaredoxin domain-containing protein [Bacillus toyonensis]PHD69342.1 NrdH-redoxin [Bacillus toyonensis]